MKCPMRIGRKAYDGGEDCDPKCAKLVRVVTNREKEYTVCADTALAMGSYPITVTPVNAMKEERE